MNRWINDSILSLSFIIAIGVALLLVLLSVAALSRHKKGSVGELALVGRVARVEKTLTPEGTVLVGGELWRARARGGESIGEGALVRIVGARGHLLEVEPARKM